MTEPIADANARALRWDRLPATPEAHAAIGEMVADMVAAMQRERALRAADHQRLVAALGSLVAELYARLRSDKPAALRMSRAKASYEAGRRDRYNPSPVTHTNACRAADWLVSEGYAGMQKGYYRRYEGFGPNAGAGEQSRIWATERLAQRLEQDHGLTPNHFGFAPWRETVVLRMIDEAGIKREVDYEDTTETRRMRENLASINSQLSQYHLSRGDKVGLVQELPPFRLTRIFSRGSFGLGGRFYRAPWIDGMPAEMRAGILIDGEETVELDYAHLHPRLLYALEGHELNGDAYSVSGWEGPALRSYVKRAFQQLLNAQPEIRLRKPRDIPASKLPKGGWQKLLQNIAERHSAIQHWFRSGRGLKLQRVDSDIAERVVLDMLRQGVCCLPVHDSFIVPTGAESALQRAMDDAYREESSRAMPSISLKQEPEPIAAHQ